MRQSRSFCQLLLFFLLCSYALLGQDTKKPAANEVMPKFPGGQRALTAFLARNIKYPLEAVAAHIEGTVLLGFIVTKEGRLEKIRCLKSLDPQMDAEAIRVVSLMPAWKPGTRDRVAVDIPYSIPIVFEIKEQ